MQHDLSFVRVQAAENLSMLLETTRSLNDKVSYSDDEPTLNVKIIRQLIAENTVRHFFA